MLDEGAQVARELADAVEEDDRSIGEARLDDPQHLHRERRPADDLELA
jgi:hypothetical protein